MLAATLLVACHNRNHTGKQSIRQETDSLMTSYHYSDSLYALCGRIDTAAFSDFITRAMVFAEAHPQDTLAPGMLYRAGVGSMILAKSAETAEYRATNAKRASPFSTSSKSNFPNMNRPSSATGSVPSFMTTSSATGAAPKANIATSSTASPTTPSRPSSNNISPSSGNRKRRFPQCTMYNEQCTSKEVVAPSHYRLNLGLSVCNYKKNRYFSLC